MKKIYGIASFLIFCFSMTLANAGNNAVQRTVAHASASHQLHSLSSSFFGSDTNIDWISMHGPSASQGHHAGKKLISFLTFDTRFSSFPSEPLFSGEGLPVWLQKKEYLSHIYPSHNFW